MVLNYLSKQLGEMCFVKASYAKKNWNEEKEKKKKEITLVAYFYLKLPWILNSILHKDNVEIFQWWSIS